MNEFRIEVKEYKGMVQRVTIRMALGPWPLRNYSWNGIELTSVERAKEIVRNLNDLPTHELRYQGFLNAMFGYPTDCDSLRKSLQEKKEREANTREYFL